MADHAGIGVMTESEGRESVSESKSHPPESNRRPTDYEAARARLVEARLFSGFVVLSGI
jgi:hypothetical protein